MAGPNPSWFRSHCRAVLASIAAVVVVAGGYALVSAVQRVRTAASRSADL